MTVEVVSAVIIRHGRILLTQRRADKDFPHAWECPGGKVEGEETHHAALDRELREELGLRVGRIAAESMWTGVFENLVLRAQRACVRVTFYEVSQLASRPVPQEGQGMGWFTAKEMIALNLAPANTNACAMLFALLTRHE